MPFMASDSIRLGTSPAYCETSRSPWNSEGRPGATLGESPDAQSTAVANGDNRQRLHTNTALSEASLSVPSSSVVRRGGCGSLRHPQAPGAEPPHRMISYRIDVADVHAHLFRVTLTVPRPAAEQRLSLPVWIPGSYLVREFARHLSGLRRRQGGRELPLQQLDKASWLARCDGRGALVRELPRLRLRHLGARRLSRRQPRLLQWHQRLPARARARGRAACAVESAALPRGWEVATAMPRRGRRGGAAFRGGRLRRAGRPPGRARPLLARPLQARGVPHEFVVAGALPGFDGERLLADAKRICETEIAFWHGPGAARAASCRSSATSSCSTPWTTATAGSSTAPARR